MERPTIVIYGKDGWPYTAAAREAYQEKGYSVDYRNVKKSAALLQEMLGHSKGVREVPVLLEQGRVEIGYGGTWGV